MTRPPVGSTGTLAELQVEAGDVVECITIKDGLFGLGDILTIDARGYAVNANIDAFTPQADVNYGRTYTLISRANPDQPLHIEAGKYYRTRDGRKVGPMIRESDGDYMANHPDGRETVSWRRDGIRYRGREPEADLLAEWQDDQPAHIIKHEGREYDLTALETPFGLLPEPVQEALRDWPHGVEAYGKCGWYFSAPEWRRHVVYCATPAPTETRVQCYRGEYYKAKEHGTCIKRPDGSIDWQSWRDEE